MTQGGCKVVKTASVCFVSLIYVLLLLFESLTQRLIRWHSSTAEPRPERIAMVAETTVRLRLPPLLHFFHIKIAQYFQSLISLSCD